MAICACCGSRYSGSSVHNDFRNWLRDNGFDKFMDEAESSYNNHNCLECNKENAYTAVGDFEVCDTCGIMFHPEEEEDEIDEYLYNLGYTDDVFYSAKALFDDCECAKCNISSFSPSDFEEEYEREHEVETDDMGEAEESDPGVYRSYEDYLMSDGPVDPCDDALWLHDQE